MKNDNMKKILLIAGICIALLGIVVGIAFYFIKGNQKPVTVYSLDLLNNADYFDSGSNLSGTIVSDHVQSVVPDTTKNIKKIHVKEGDIVKEGDVLLEYDMEQEELELQLQDLQIQSSEGQIERMEKELETLKNTKTVGSVSPGGNDSIMTASFFPKVSLASLTLLEEGDNDEEGDDDKSDSTEKPATTEVKPATTEAKPATTEAKPATTEAKPTTTEAKPATTEAKPATTEAKPATTEAKPATTETEPATTEQKKPDEKLYMQVKDLKECASFSGDGSTKEKAYVYLLLQKKGVAENGTTKIVHGSIYGHVLNQLIKLKKYVVIREYASEQDYMDKKSPASEITLTPKSTFSQAFASNKYYSISAIGENSMQITKISIKPSRSDVQKGESYNFILEVEGKNTSDLAVAWSISGNKSKKTTIHNGTLYVSTEEKSSKIIVKAKVSNKSVQMSLKVKGTKKQETEDTTDNTDDGNDDTGYDYPGDDTSGGSDSGYTGSDDITYTKEELAEAISDKEDEIAEAKQKLKESKINYKEAKQVLDAATIKATINGTVTTAYAKNDVPSNGSPVIVIKSEKGLYVQTQISEMDLDTVKVGGTINCTSWDTNEIYEAVVQEISDYPTSSQDVYNSGNPNGSYYAMTAYIDQPDGLEIGGSVTITYNSQSMGTVEGDMIALQKAYVRTDDGQPYVYKVGENHRLVKQYVKTGSTIYGQYIQILSGLTSEDYLAFPYGVDVKEGAKTKISEDGEDIIY